MVTGILPHEFRARASAERPSGERALPNNRDHLWKLSTYSPGSLVSGCRQPFDLESLGILHVKGIPPTSV